MKKNSTAMEIRRRHVIKSLPLHIIGRVTHRLHLHPVPHLLEQPDHITITNQGIAIQPQLGHGSDIFESIVRQPLQPVILQIQSLESRQVIEGVRLDFSKLIRV